MGRDSRCLVLLMHRIRINVHLVNCDKSLSVLRLLCDSASEAVPAATLERFITLPWGLVCLSIDHRVGEADIGTGAHYIKQEYVLLIMMLAEPSPIDPLHPRFRNHQQCIRRR
jgi:hypothetical protein